MIRTRFPALLTAIVLATTVFARADEFDALRLKWRDMLTQGTNATRSDALYSAWIAQVESSAQQYLNSFNTNAGRTFLWSTYQNLATDSSDITGTYTRLRAMALGYAVRGSALENNAVLRSAIISGLDWMHSNYYNATGVVYDNWFDFEIAAPLALNDITVLLHSDLSPAQVSNYMDAIDHFTPTPTYSVISSNLTAANKVWKSLAVCLRGVIVKDGNKIDLAHLGLSDVFPYVTTNDGFYADGSFIFHNFFPYNGGYGVELLDTMGSMMQLLDGSAWQVTDPARTNLFRWVHDSYEPFLFKGGLMQMVAGRYYTRTGDDHAQGHELLGAILRIAQFAPPADAAAYKAFVKASIQSDTFRNFVARERPPYNVWANAVLNDPSVVPLPEATEHRQFPGMDRVVHRTPNWAFGLAMWSSRVANYESTRGENLKGWYTAEGMTYLYNSDLGHYADDFWPTVDPYRLPGTTVSVAPRANGSGDARRSQNNQVGGASILGRYGAVAMHLNAWNSTLSARKSWFMFDDEIVCLGNSVSSSDTPAFGVETIVENRRLGLYGNNAFTVNGAAKPNGPGWSETMANTSWAHLAGSTPGADIGYYFPSSTTVQALRESRSGALYDLNTTYGSSTRSTRHYLTMYLDHGTNLAGETYSYVLLPGMTAAAVEAYAANSDITVVQNNSKATAVKENKLGITAVNFWGETNYSVAGISCDRKASVIFRDDGGVMDIGVSDPTQTNTGVINVEFSTAASLTLSTDAGVSVLQTSPTIKLAINTSNQFGATLRARFVVGPVQTNALLPVADAYVQNGVETNANFGITNTLKIKASGSSQAREAYLRFDLSSVSGTILGANLRLLPVTIDEPLYHAVALVADNSWSETGITWNNKPLYGSEFARWLLGPVGTPVVVPVTALAQQAASGNQKLSLCIYSTGTPPPTNGGFAAYGSKENGVANRPQLVVTFIRRPPTVTLSTSSGMAIDAPGTVTLAADAQDADGSIAGVEFYNGTTRVAQLLTPPYGVTVPNLPPGAYHFTAVATDNSGLTATSGPVSISVYAPEPAGRGTGLHAEYFTGQNLTTLAFTRTDTNVNFSWGLTSPIPAVSPANPFSVRWSGKLQARHAGPHQFHTVTDDGVRLWIDGQLVIDHWSAHLQTEDTGSISLVPGRYYDITMEYYDASFSAVAALYWTQPGLAKEIIPPSQLYPADQGLRATYYSGTNFNSAVLTRIDDAVNFFWNTNSPDPTALPGTYSVRWTGKVKANAAGQYQFFVLSDDAVRLWVNGQLIISNWAAHTQTEDVGTVTLATTGQFYDVTMEYFNAGGTGTAALSWRPPGESKQVIPSGSLTPHQNNNPPALTFVPNRFAARNGQLTFTATATDPDVPGQLVYSLDAGAPAGAVVHPVTGVFSWTPSDAQPQGPHDITLRVTDMGSPAMSDAQTFTITVLSPLSVVRSGNDTFLTWPDTGELLRLYSATNLTPPVTWLPVNTTPVLSNGQWTVPLPAPTNAIQFFHLQMP